MTGALAFRIFVGILSFNALLGALACGRGFIRTDKGPKGTIACGVSFVALSLIAFALAGWTRHLGGP
jgi:hypothetical protein